MSCPKCSGPTKPLFTGEYCVNECDLKPPTPPKARAGNECPTCKTHGIAAATMTGGSLGKEVKVITYHCGVCDLWWNNTVSYKPLDLSKLTKAPTTGRGFTFPSVPHVPQPPYPTIWN